MPITTIYSAYEDSLGRLYKDREQAIIGEAKLMAARLLCARTPEEIIRLAITDETFRESLNALHELKYSVSENYTKALLDDEIPF